MNRRNVFSFFVMQGNSSCQEEISARISGKCAL